MGWRWRHGWCDERAESGRRHAEEGGQLRVAVLEQRSVGEDSFGARV